MGFADEFVASMKGDNLEVRNDDDRIDRLNYRWTVILLIVFAGLVTAETYVFTERINCWVPAHFKGAWESYVNDYCWIRNTYYLPWDEHVPLDYSTRDKYPIVYYQWVPLFMLIQAIFFYLPILTWRTMNHRTGIDVNDIVETAEQVQRSEDEEIREKWTKFLTRQLDRYLGISKKPVDDKTGPCTAGNCNCKWFLSVCCFCCMGRRFGNYMTILYIFVKVLFVANVIGQLFILNWFLGRNFNMYGIRLIQSWMAGEIIEESPYFPRVTFCDVEVRRLGNLHRYTVQCVLPINMFNEKIYAFIWFWFFFVATMSVFSLIQWVLRMVIRVDSQRYVTKRLVSGITKKKHLDMTMRTDRDRVKVFIRDYLRADGVLVLRLIDYNTNKVTAEDLLASVYVNYLKRKKLLLEDDDDDEKKEKDDKAEKDTDSMEKAPLTDSPGSSHFNDTDRLVPPSAPHEDELDLDEKTSVV